MIPNQMMKAYPMTYQTSPENFSAPAASSTGIADKVFSTIASFFRNIGNSLIAASEASSRIHQIQALEAKSDEELAEMGLRRDQIVHHVFKDLYYC